MPTVCVIGAGLAGLTAARDLGRLGIRVVVLESARDAGGLASSVVVAGRPVERFYHFICRGDADLIDLVDELGLSSRLHWRRTSTSYLHQGTLYPFGSPLDLLRFRPVPFLQRVRFGINVISGRYRRSWATLDSVSATVVAHPPDRLRGLPGHLGPAAADEVRSPLTTRSRRPGSGTASTGWPPPAVSSGSRSGSATSSSARRP